MSNQAGVRKDLPVEIVFETAAVLKHAYLFETASEGILCREAVPGSTILYIRDTIKDKILYSRPLDAPAADTADGMEDTSPTQVVSIDQSASASTDLAVIPEEPRPRPTTNLKFPCPKCQNNCRVGQFYCGKCTKPLRDLAHSNVRRSVQMARLRAVSEICARSGMAPSTLSVQEIRGSQTSDISEPGLLSLDAESTQAAKKQVKSALKLGYASVLDRFTKDVAFALRSTERGLTRSAMLVQDAIATAVLLKVLSNALRAWVLKVVWLTELEQPLPRLRGSCFCVPILLPSSRQASSTPWRIPRCDFVAWSGLLPE